jgi:hypothetical protein
MRSLSPAGAVLLRRALFSCPAGVADLTAHPCRG